MEGQIQPEIAFFDVETTIPTRSGQAFALLEFGGILVCPRKLIELESYSTLIRPADLSLITPRSVLCNGIGKDDVVSAPAFEDVADKIYHFLHGRIWAGHNILKFDCIRIREAFSAIHRPAPEPKGTIDSLVLLTQRFGRKAGNMKMASLANYFGLGQQAHRSLEDVRMNFEVLKCCATVLFLESSLSDNSRENSWGSPNSMKSSHINGNFSPGETIGLNANTPSSSQPTENLITPTEHCSMEIHTTSSFTTSDRIEVLSDRVESIPSRPDPFNMSPLGLNLENTFLESDNMDEEESGSPSQLPSTEFESEGSGSYSNFLEPDKISIPSISVVLAPSYRGMQKIRVLHNHAELQICCMRLKVRFGVSNKYFPRLSFVVDASGCLCQILDAVDNHAHRLTMDSRSSSKWRPLVTRKPNFMKFPTVRLQLPTVVNGDAVQLVTDIYKKETSRARMIALNRFDAEALDALIAPGTCVDAYFSFDAYDYQQNAGIRLVAKKLILHSN
ncbi:unnamed protein product [Cuscuta campestris]|uniref:Exonuclease domain-containing protein n=1 Tax=Cuscuta campestris TaxID=132261 RepID=A0A484ND54_9ASTE|nr:unnamed protein product [Cuscuta campestris]